MRVLLVNRFYGTEHVPTGRMASDVVRVLQRDGHEVHILTCRDTYADTATETPVASAGLFVHYLWVGTGWPRLCVWLLFWLQACLCIPCMRWERCVLLTDPPFLVCVAWLVRLLYGAKRRVYWWTMDLYPEALVADGLLRPQTLPWRLLSTLNELGLQALAGVICLGERQRRRLAQYSTWQARPGFCVVIPPWDYRPLPRVARAENRFLAQNQWQSKKISLYTGNLGRGHTHHDMLAAARALASRHDTHWMFVFVCRGAARHALETESASLANVVVLDYVPPEYTADLLWSADVHLITMADGWQGIVVPSKLYGVLQTDATVLFIGPQDADTVEQIVHYDAGAIVPNGCGAEAIIDTLTMLGDPRYSQARLLDLHGAGRIVSFITQP